MRDEKTNDLSEGHDDTVESNYGSQAMKAEEIADLISKELSHV